METGEHLVEEISNQIFIKDNCELDIEMLGALELGIIPPSQNISASLQTLTRQDRRIAKRKFRKLKRRLLTGFHPETPNNEVRKMVSAKCIREGMRVLAGSDQK